jgi:4-hydroxy-tetrahydrodipicolinate synthase
VHDRSAIAGIVPPVATPLTVTEDVDRAGMGRVIEYLLGGGVHGIFVLGATGEFPWLDDRQRATAVEAAVDAVAGRVPVIAGIAEISRRHAIANARTAYAAGADFVMATAPYFGSMAVEQGWILEHFRAIAGETGAPVMLYNVPPWIADISPATIATLAELDNVVGMKDSADFIHLQDVLARTRGRNFRVLCGIEGHLLGALLMGAHGATPSSANLNPALFVRLYEAATEGRVEEARPMQEGASRFVQELEAFPSWFSLIKAGLHLLGLCGPTVAGPLPALTADETERLRAILVGYGLLS